jgi:hypothetical protein
MPTSAELRHAQSELVKRQSSLHKEAKERVELLLRHLEENKRVRENLLAELRSISEVFQINITEELP